MYLVNIERIEAYVEGTSVIICHFFHVPAVEGKRMKLPLPVSVRCPGAFRTHEHFVFGNLARNERSDLDIGSQCSAHGYFLLIIGLRLFTLLL
jgi:hypothetical protein